MRHNTMILDETTMTIRYMDDHVETFAGSLSVEYSASGLNVTCWIGGEKGVSQPKREALHFIPHCNIRLVKYEDTPHE